MAEQTFYVEDVCKPKSNLNDGVTRFSYGMILVTHTDVESHGTQRVAHRHHRDIPHAEYKNFVRSGVPPKGTVLVEWVAVDKECRTELIPTKYLELVDRALLVGDFVKRRTEDSMSGAVIGVSVKCSIMPVLYRPNYTDPYTYPPFIKPHQNNPLYPTLVWEAVLGPDYLIHDEPPPPRALLTNIPVEELKPAKKYHEHDLVIYHDWVGVIEEVVDTVKAMLADNRIVAIRDMLGHVPHRPAFWLHAQVPELVDFDGYPITRPDSYIAESHLGLPPVGFVVERTPSWIDVRWLCRRLYSDPTVDSIHRSNEPPEKLHKDVLESGEVHVYDQSRCPPKAPSFSPTRVDLVQSDRVRFKDISGAAMKYDGTISKNHLQTIDPSYTAGHDLNVFEVRGTETSVRVQWQDQSITECRSIELIPENNAEDENLFYPGEIVVSHDEKEVKLEPWIVEPKKVGAVQNVNAADRIARIRWFSGADVKYPDIPDLEEDINLLPGSTTGTRSDKDQFEDISVYDIKHAPGLNKRRGDMVILHPPPSAHTVNQGEQIDWFGEVIDLGLDGLLTIRLGALDMVQDIRIAPEHVTIAYSEDILAMIEESDEDEDDEYDELEDEMDSFGLTNMIASEIREIFFQDANGNQIRVEDETGEMEFDDEWLTEDEQESDEELPDLIPRDDDVPINTDEDDYEDDDEESTPGDSEPVEAQIAYSFPEPAPEKPVTPSETTQAGPDTLSPPSSTPSEPPNAPPHFAILDTPVPTSHGYYDTYPTLHTSLLKRIQKEHRILSSSLPSGIYVRTWESRLDVFRALIVGPRGTPYEHAPFVVDLRVPPNYPASPPEAFFHSWTAATGKGYGPVNPNLYENGKICLSLLGTWDGEAKSENWVKDKSNLLQVLVSIQGLVLVREPYFNEAGYEVRAGSEESVVPSRIYSEKIYFVARGFIVYALKNGVADMADVVKWLYCAEDEGAPKLLDRAIEAASGLVEAGESGNVYETGGLTGISKGALMMLRRQLGEMEKLQDRSARHDTLR